MASGYVGNCQTFPITHGTDDVSLSGSFCSFVSKVCGRDERWHYFKGRIIYRHKESRKIIVKALRGNDQSLSLTECHAEVRKLRLARTVLEENPDLRVKVFTTYYSEIDEVSTSCRGGSRGMEEGTRVLIQERTKAKLEDFRPLSGGNHPGLEPYPHPHLLQFVRAVYRYSQGRYVISGLQGFKGGDSDSSTYFVTSLTVHSVSQEFGLTDRGAEGISDFLACTGLLDILRHIAGVVNRPETESASCQSLQLQSPSSTSADAHNPIDLTTYERATTGDHPILDSAVLTTQEETPPRGDQRSQRGDHTSTASVVLTTLESVPRGDHPFFDGDVAMETPPPAYHELSWQHQRNANNDADMMRPPPAYCEQVDN